MITITDGGIGDLDSKANGVISLLGGLGAPKIEVINHLVTFDPLNSTYSYTPDTGGCELMTDHGQVDGPFVGKFIFDATLANISNSSLSSIALPVSVLTNGNLLVDPGFTPAGEGLVYRFRGVDGYQDGVLRPGETVNVPFEICLRDKEPFKFFVDVIGRVE